jgi:hypothetical protein
VIQSDFQSTQKCDGGRELDVSRARSALRSPLHKIFPISRIVQIGCTTRSFPSLDRLRDKISKIFPICRSVYKIFPTSRSIALR